MPKQEQDESRIQVIVTRCGCIFARRRQELHRKDARWIYGTADNKGLAVERIKIRC